jgi:hypothetical protein
MRARFVCLLAAAAMATPVALTASAPPAHAASYPRILMGLTDHWKDPIVQDESQLGMTGGNTSGIVGTFMPWATTSPSLGVSWSSWVRNRGGAPMVDLMPPTNVTLAQIAAGAQDNYLKAWADALAAWNNPFLLRLFPEMNGTWESYTPGTRGQTAAQFLAAWKHVYNLFRAEGATQVMFVWNPTKYYNGQPYPYSALWPGTNYVNWIALDGYNWADRGHGTGWPYYVFRYSLALVHQIPGTSAKPFLIAEMGCAPYAYKPQWITRMYSDLQSLGALAAVYFDENPNPNWRLDSSASALSAARAAVHASNVVYHGRVSLAAIDHLIRTGHPAW